MGDDKNEWLMFIQVRKEEVYIPFQYYALEALALVDVSSWFYELTKDDNESDS